jgi:hypothetical protein
MLTEYLSALTDLHQYDSQHHQHHKTTSKRLFADDQGETDHIGAHSRITKYLVVACDTASATLQFRTGQNIQRRQF